MKFYAVPTLYTFLPSDPFLLYRPFINLISLSSNACTKPPNQPSSNQNITYKPTQPIEAHPLRVLPLFAADRIAPTAEESEPIPTSSDSLISCGGQSDGWIYSVAHRRVDVRPPL